jgi:hypothetical protein
MSRSVLTRRTPEARRGRQQFMYLNAVRQGRAQIREARVLRRSGRFARNHLRSQQRRTVIGSTSNRSAPARRSPT